MKSKKLWIFGVIGFFVLPVLLTLGLAALIVVGGGQAAAACTSTSSDDGGPTAPENTQLFEAIKIVSAGNPRLMVSMLTGSHLESKWNNNAVGAGSFGPYQIQDPGNSGGPHPDITVAQAMDPAYSTNYMAPEYRSALRRVDPEKWLANPEAAAEETAYRAERPAQDYYVYRGADDVRQSYEASLDVMRSMGVPTDFSGTAAASDTATSSATATVAPVQASCNPYANVGSGSAAVAIAAAEKWLGYPYVYGGGGINGPTRSSLAHGNFNDVGFDCSSLMQYAYHQAGIDLPRTAAQQWFSNQAHAVPLGQEQPGDLIFFEPSSSGPGHVGMVVDPGKGVMINAPRTGKPVGYSGYRNWGAIVGIVHLLSNDTTTATATAAATD
jgi:cell wall-associated NlpC family hydrolase